MKHEADVIVIGAGAGGPVVAKELGEKGIKVLLLEAGPWYGHNKWPKPNDEPGDVSDRNPDNLSLELLSTHYTNYESDMNGIVDGKLRWGSANRNRSSWFRGIPQGGFAWQTSGVGGSTQHYFGNSPRAFPSAVENVWPISYHELIPYYEKVEATLPVLTAPMTTKEELFFYGAKKAGWSLLKTLDVINPGYRPQPNAILSPNSNINDPCFQFDGKTVGCVLCGHCVNGCKVGPSVSRVAKRSTLVSYVPMALNTGNVTIRPNAFVTKILTKTDKQGVAAVGVRCRNTWTGEVDDFKAQVVVMAAGCVETPRLWLNSKLPYNSWVGCGLSNHWYDTVSGIFNESDLKNIVGVPGTEPYVGQTSAARFDYPGLGAIQGVGLSPGLTASMLFALSRGFHSSCKPYPNEPWDVKGRVAGTELKNYMLEYSRTLSLLLLTDDEVAKRNAVTTHPYIKDEHGYVPVVSSRPSKKDRDKRNRLAIIAADILKNAGAKTILRSDSLPNLFAHLECTMRMGYVVNTDCEAFQVKRLYIADNSVHFNSLGGPNPTLTTQALATRTAEKIASTYFR